MASSLFEKIAHYNVNIKHIPGEDNVPADILSRLAHSSSELQDIDYYIPVKPVEIFVVQIRNG